MAATAATQEGEDSMQDFDPRDLIWIQDVPTAKDLSGPDGNSPAVPTLYGWLRNGKIGRGPEILGKLYLSKQQISRALWGQATKQPNYTPAPPPSAE